MNSQNELKWCGYCYNLAVKCTCDSRYQVAEMRNDILEDGIEAACELQNWIENNVDDATFDKTPVEVWSRITNAVCAKRQKVIREKCLGCNGTGYTDAVGDDRCGRCGATGYVEMKPIAESENIHLQLLRQSREIHELRAAIFGSDLYDPKLTHGQFVEMAKLTESARKGAVERAERAEARVSLFFQDNLALQRKLENWYVAAKNEEKERERIREQANNYRTKWLEAEARANSLECLRPKSRKLF